MVWNSTSSTTWDTYSSQNWSNLVTHVSPDYFYTGDSVLFDDSVPGVAISVTLDGGAVIPAAITNNSTLNNFTISGAGKITGATSIVKLGDSTLTLSSSNDFSGPVLVLGGTLAAGNGSALGLTSGATLVTNSGTFDINGQNLGLEPLIVSGAGVGGNGAIVNNGAQQIHALRSVTLAGDTTFGGPGGNSPFVPPGPGDGTNRWDIRAASTGTTNEPGTFLSTGGQPYKLTKVGSNQVAFVSVAIDAALGDIDIRGGNLAFQLNTTGMGNPTNTVTIESTGLLSFYHDPFPFNKVFVLNGDGATIYNENNVNTIIGPMTLIGSNVFNIGGTALHLTNNTVGGNILYLEGTNTYTGDTVVNAGTLALVGTSVLTDSPHLTVAAGATLDASARADGTLTLAGTQLLAGNGAVNGSLTVGSAATVSPGLGGIGALTVTNVVSLQGTTAMELGSSTNDVIRGAATINYGGTLSLSFTPGSLTAGNTNKLFSATTYSGSFASITPPTPGAGLLWDTSNLINNGTLKVITPLVPRPGIVTFTLTGGNVILMGTNGPSNGTYYVLNSTNVAVPLTNWTRLSTNQFDGSGGFNSTNAVNASLPRQFFTLQLQ